jgi:drug/metabolite transporter (DMT)-like permease
VIYLLAFAMTISASVASMFLKKASSESIWRMYRSRNLYWGGALYVASALINIWLLQKLPYSVVVPIGALTYIWTLVLSRKYLHEKITLKKVLGIIVIVIGVVLVAL